MQIEYYAARRGGEQPLGEIGNRLLGPDSRLQDVVVEPAEGGAPFQLRQRAIDLHQRAPGVDFALVHMHVVGDGNQHHLLALHPLAVIQRHQ